MEWLLTEWKYDVPLVHLFIHKLRFQIKNKNELSDWPFENPSGDINDKLAYLSEVLNVFLTILCLTVHCQFGYMDRENDTFEQKWKKKSNIRFYI